MSSPYRPEPRSTQDEGVPAGREDASSQQRHVRRFVVVHVVAILAVYGLAIHAGGGWAAPPFPVDERVVARAAIEPRRPLPSAETAPPTPADDGHALVPRLEIEPPWRFDADGNVRMREL